VPGSRSHPSPTRPESQSWYERDDGARLDQDQALIAEHYPELHFQVDHEKSRVEIDGLLRLVADCGITTPIHVRLVFPDDYPDAEPRAFDIGARFPHDSDHHFFTDGQCCLWLDLDSGWDRSNPNALLSFLDQLVLFFDRQLTYEATGSWPGGERPHGRNSATIDLVLDLINRDSQLLDALMPTFANRSTVGRNSSCPCGNAKKFKRCHLGIVEHVSRRIGLDRLRQAAQWQLASQSRPAPSDGQ
jgi:hypothetical protein